MDLRFLRDALLRVAKPYSHLYHADGSLYMERFIVRQRRDEQGGHIRLHHIVTEDRDVHMHDHPFSFYSLVLTGGYLEARPVDRGPCFTWHSSFLGGKGLWIEDFRITQRYPWSFEKRHACDRHRILHVELDTWTLVFAGPLRQWWGFYTPKGKIHHRDYESHHVESARTER